jgi:hypothetical protein
MRPRHPDARCALTPLLIVLGTCACDSRPPAAVQKEMVPAKAVARPEPPRKADPEEDAPKAARTIAVELHRVATRHGQIKLHRLSDGEIVLSGGLGLARGRAGEELVQKTDWLAGLAPAEPGANWRVRALGGRGDDLWLTAVRDGEPATLAVYRRRGDGWAVHEPVDGAEAHYADYTVWPEGQAIALRLGPGDEVGLTVLDDDGARPAPLRLEAAGLAGAPRPTKIAGLASGELFAAVPAGPGPVTGLLRWGPGEQSAFFAPLPALESRAPRQVTALVEGAAHEVLVGDGVEIDEELVPYVARFDGTSWRLLDPPPTRGTVIALAEGAGPTIWAIVDEEGPADSLWRLHAPSDWDIWERVELAPLTLAEDAAGTWFWDQAAGGWASGPAGPEAAAIAYTPSPTALGLDPAAQLWISARLLLSDGTATSRWAVLRTSPAPAAPLALLDDGQIYAAQQDLGARRAPRAGDPTCSQVYVQLYTVFEDSPEVGTPELRAALTGPLAPLLLGEVRSQGERQVGLLLSAGEYETHRSAIAGLASKLRFKSRASCGHPPLLRGHRAEG